MSALGGAAIVGRARSWRGSTARQSLLAAVDQGLVSVANFTMSVIVGRLAGLDALGANLLGFPAVCSSGRKGTCSRSIIRLS